MMQDKLTDNLEFHPLANIFPMLPDDELIELSDDIKQRGLNNPIWLLDGKILDGRNRYRACILAGVIPAFKQFTGESPTAFVLSENLHRRHLNQSQKGVVALDAEKWLAIEAEKRMLSGVANPPPQIGEGDDDYDFHLTDDEERRDRTCGSCGEEFYGRPSEHSCDEKSKKKARRARESASQAAKLVGVSRNYVQDAKAIAQASPERLEAIRRGEKTITEVKRELKKEEVVKRLEEVAAREPDAPVGKFDVIVLDPPWPMQKIERDIAPEQVAFEYPTMTIGEIEDMKMASEFAAANCHVFMWTTQKFLPDSFRIFDRWGINYVLTMVWHKPGGFQPFGMPQYNCEFVIYGRIGTPQFIDQKAFFTCFNAPRGAHSEKPGEFYDVIRRVTAGRRLDIFNRRKIEGFIGWGKEVGK